MSFPAPIARQDLSLSAPTQRAISGVIRSPILSLLLSRLVGSSGVGLTVNEVVEDVVLYAGRGPTDSNSPSGT